MVEGRMADGREGAAPLEAQLAEALPGFAALDRDLRLGDVRVQLVGRAGDGRLVLVQRVETVDAEVVTEVLDLLAGARAQAPFLARHLGAGTEGPPPLVVVVATRVDERARRRLSTLDAESVRLLEVREIASARARSTFLVAHGEAHEAPSVAAVGERLADLDGDARRRVDVLVDRLRRVDDELALTTTDEGLEWRWRGRPICALDVEGGIARASIPGEEARVLADDPTLETFVDAALSRWIAVSEEVEGLTTVEVRPPVPRPLVGPEELDALHE